MDRVEKQKSASNEDKKNLINVMSICTVAQDQEVDEITVAAGELVLPYGISDKWLWVRSQNDLGVYPRELLVPAQEGTFFQYPEDKKCPFCGILVTKSSYETHVRKFPGGECLSEELKCTKCLKILMSKHGLKRHQCENVDFTFKFCIYCKKEFFSRQTLKTHLIKNSCMQRCQKCFNPCTSCNSPDYFDDPIYDKLIVNESLVKNEFIKLYKDKDNFKKKIRNRKFFYYFVKHMRYENIENQMINILMEIINERIVPFEYLQEENVLFLVFARLQFKLGIEHKNHILRTVSMAWGLDLKKVSGIESLHTALKLENYKSIGGQKRTRSSSPEDHKRKRSSGSGFSPHLPDPALPVVTSTKTATEATSPHLPDPALPVATDATIPQSPVNNGTLKAKHDSSTDFDNFLGFNNEDDLDLEIFNSLQDGETITVITSPHLPDPALPHFPVPTLPVVTTTKTATETTSTQLQVPALPVVTSTKTATEATSPHLPVPTLPHLPDPALPAPKKVKKKKPKTCDNCGKVLCDTTSLRQHKNKCLKIYPYKCNVCGKGFAQLNGLKYHLKTHNNSSSE